MAFRFKRRESVADAFARMTGEQISAALGALEKSPAGGVHEARKCIKRLRGLLRLFRRALPDGCYERENDALRSAGRSLSGVRDAQVLLAGFDIITKRVRLPGIAVARREFSRPVKEAAKSNHHPAPAQAATATLRTIRARLPALKPDSDWSLLSRCLRASYRRARKSHAAARAEPGSDSLHTWRKRSKDFQYQMQLLRKIDPHTMRPLVRKAANLTDLLGDDHDLAALDARLLTTGSISAALREKLRARIARRRKKLQHRAFALGGELFFEKPSAIVKDLGRLWKHWRRGRG